MVLEERHNGFTVVSTNCRICCKNSKIATKCHFRGVFNVILSQFTKFHCVIGSFITVKIASSYVLPMIIRAMAKSFY